MAGSNTILEYIDQTRALLLASPKFGLMVQRQIQGRLLPELSGTQNELEEALVRLLDFCIDHTGSAITAEFIPNETTATLRKHLEASPPAETSLRFPAAAQAVLKTIDALAEHRVLPIP